MSRPFAQEAAAIESTFRDANEAISESARELGFEGPVPFVCECSDPRCHKITRLPLDEYEQVRSKSSTFLVVPEHQHASKPDSRIVRDGIGYVVLEKTGTAAEVTAALDPRRR